MRITFILGLLLCAAGAQAQQEAAELDFFSSSLAEILDTPLLAASYAEEKPSDTAATAYVVTAETIEKRGYETLVDLLSDMPQFQVQRNSDVRRLNLVSVRGIPSSERLTVLYDGIKVNPPTGDLFALAGQLSLRGAERVEVVLGPMSSVYGADAFSGVINVVTRAADSPSAGLSFGSFDARSAGVYASSRFSGDRQGSPSVSAIYEERGGASPRLPSFYREDYSWYNTEYQAGQARLQDGSVTAVPVRPYDAAEKSSFLKAKLSLESLELGFIKMKEAHSSSIGVKPDLTLYTEDARFATGYWTVYGRHSYVSPGEDWKLNTVLSYFDYEISPESRFINSFSGYEDAYKYAFSRTASVEQTLSFEAAEGFPVLAGVSYQENSVLPYTADLDHRFDSDQSPVSQQFVYNGSTIPVDFHSLSYSNAGAFLRLQRQLGYVSLSAGLRYDKNTAYGETWNPRAGLVWRPGGSEHTVAKVLYGEAFLAPSPFQAYKHFGAFVPALIVSTNTSGYYSYFFHVVNGGLKPEKVRSVEGSLTHDLGASLRVSFNPYYAKVRDLIQDVIVGSGTFKGVPVASLEQAENTGTMEAYGATVKVDGLLRSGRWSFEPWAAYTHSEGRLAGDPLPFNSRHVLQGGVSVTRGRWTVTPKALYRSYTRNQDGSRVAPFATADFFVRYAGAGRGEPALSAWLGLRNIFDRRYYNAAYGGGVDHLEGAPQTPFEASLGMTYKF